ncbi:MAG: hypothetical protein KatS3mg015_3110 [Fimbriimonadales bacterium]|nr:MAG: hypothetical protein KatS3mg015_3110 [Fimbriimonadales bacterium]
MPVTVKLSKLFYERLGEEIANEMVDWFNAVDASYRDDLRQLNELNFARFDAKLEQRVVELDAKIDGVAGALDAKIDRVAGELDAKIDQVAVQLDAKINHVAAQLDSKIDRVAAELKEVLERRLGEHTRWLVAAWASLLIPIIGLWFRG